jgi:hypothetical protein
MYINFIKIQGWRKNSKNQNRFEKIASEEVMAIVLQKNGAFKTPSSTI